MCRLVNKKNQIVNTITVKITTPIVLFLLCAAWEEAILLVTSPCDLESSTDLELSFTHISVKCSSKLAGSYSPNLYDKHMAFV